MEPDHSPPYHFGQFESYDWDRDEEFQNGLQAILASNSSSQQASDLTLQAKCFYFSRKFNAQIDPAAYQAWIQRDPQEYAAPTDSKPPMASSNASKGNLSASVLGPGAESAAPYPTSFSKIIDLITKGDPIPGVKEVPDTLLKGRESQPKTAKRKKPWERESKAGVGDDEPGTGRVK